MASVDNKTRKSFFNTSPHIITGMMNEVLINHYGKHSGSKPPKEDDKERKKRAKAQRKARKGN